MGRDGETRTAPRTARATSEHAYLLVIASDSSWRFDLPAGCPG